MPTPVENLYKHLVINSIQVEQWFRRQWLQSSVKPPIYSSVDIRDSGYRVAPVDTNLFPAGFNNLSPSAHPLAVQAFASAIGVTCPTAAKVLLIPENHTRNIFYLRNVAVLSYLLRQAGVMVRVGSINPELTEPHTVSLDIEGQPPLSMAQSLLIEPIKKVDGQLMVQDADNHVFTPCMILLNNDLSGGIPALLKDNTRPIFPDPRLGWHHRRKSQHFAHYRAVVLDFCAALDINPSLLMGDFEVVEGVNFQTQQGFDTLKTSVKALFERLHKTYAEQNIPHKPYVVMKADSGTYGMAVMAIHDPKEVEALNRKARNKLAVGKEGLVTDNILLQEGIMSVHSINGEAAEPVLYMVDKFVVGGFYRIHAEKGDHGILNAPGMKFQDIPFTHCCNLPDPSKDIHEECNELYSYGIVSRLAALAAALEQKALQD